MLALPQPVAIRDFVRKCRNVFDSRVGFHGITDELDLMHITSSDDLPSDIPEFARQKLVAHARSLAILGKGGRKEMLMQKRGI